MIPVIVTSLILMKKRRTMELFSPKLRKLWKEWELRVMVIVSLVLQVVLILTGNRRKYIHGIWIKFVVWIAYLLADSVASIALGILSNNLGDIYEGRGSLDRDNELTAFWAPFLLLHLGGPDTITAYSIEDNELFLRHFFWLIIQTIVAIYIFLMGWTQSRLSFLTMSMIVVGSIKYGERTWTLWKASSEKLRDWMLSSPEAGPNYSKLMDEYCLKQAEGYYVEIKAMADVKEISITNEAQSPTAAAADQERSRAQHDENLLKANVLFRTYKLLFADLILSSQDAEFSQAEFKKMESHPEDAFEVIAIELGLMFDLLYTKARANYTHRGLAGRFITFSLTSIVLGVFCWDNKNNYKKVDVYITYLLLVVGILLEMYAATMLLISDQTRYWWTEGKKTSKAPKANKTMRTLVRIETRTRTITSSPGAKKIINFLIKLVKLPRWSDKMAQYSLLRVCLKEKRKFGLKLIEKYRFTSYKDVISNVEPSPSGTPKSDTDVIRDELRKAIFKHVEDRYDQFYEKKQRGDPKTIVDFCGQRGKDILDKNYKGPDLSWSVEVEFDQSILVWHIATELCYYSLDSEEVNLGDRRISKRISRYMLYLLVRYPFLLPVGIGLIRYRDTRAEAEQVLKERMPVSSTDEEKTMSSLSTKKKSRIEACRKLLGVNPVVPAREVKGDRSKSVLFDACRLASALNKIADKKEKWKMIRDIWLEMLTYAACQCKGSDHVKQLRRGGELLTHVWLLMAHFGITEQIKISEGHARARLLAK